MTSLSTAPIPQQSPHGRPFLVGRGPATRARHTPLVLWHLLSLDAPAVAATWTAFVAWCAGVPIATLDPVAMFLAVWILYAADRLLDAKPLFQSPFLPEMEERHRFHDAHRSLFLWAIVGATLPLGFLLHRTAEALLHLYILLACLLSAWFLLVHARPVSSTRAHRLPKELALGMFFPAAIFIPTVARAATLKLPLLAQAVAFGALCTLNGFFLYAWEHPRRRGSAHRTTRWGARWVTVLALIFTLLTGILFLGLKFSPSPWQPVWISALPHPTAIFLACSFSGILLLLLHAFRDKLSRTALRSLADLVLLTPVPVYLVHLAHSAQR